MFSLEQAKQGLSNVCAQGYLKQFIDELNQPQVGE